MPTYIVKKASERDNPDAKTWEVFCSHKELQEMCLEYNIMQVPSAPKIISGVGSLLNKTDDGWKENLNRIKKNAGRGNTIKV